MRAVILLAFLVSAGCADETPPPSSAGVGPDSARVIAEKPKTSIELVEPIAPEPVAVVESTPVVTPAAPKIQFEIDPLGRFEVITWEEALRRAEAKVTAQNAQSTLRALRQELQLRKR